MGLFRMLIRQYGANSGIKDYLINGIKNGRDFSRDELDERIVLSGNLDITDAVINSIATNSERYNHYTLSFAEDHLTPEVAKEITEEFRKFAMSAYRDYEYSFYAEMHNPRMKSYTDKSTGESVERKPHIHIVIPKMNLVSGTYLNSFGLLKHNIKFMDAFQESINHKYGLISPKDRRRTSLVDGGDMLSRYKADVFNGGNKEVKAALLNLALERDVQSLAELRVVAAELGDVKIRNSGSENEYLNLKVNDAPKGINLKDYPFTKDFLSLPLSEKLIQVQQHESQSIYRRDNSGAEPKKSESELNEILAQWHSTRARELRFVSASVYKAYKSSSQGEKALMLNNLEFKFYQKYEGELNVGNRKHVTHGNNGKRNTPNQPMPFQRGDLHWLSRRRMVWQRQNGEMLLPHKVPNIMADGGDARNNNVRRLPQGNSTTGEPAVISGPEQLLSEHQRSVAQAKQADQSEIKEIRLLLDAARLLAAVAQSHGVDTQKYSVTKGNDGADRIVCGKRRYTVNDFLTKELHLNWKDAERILRKQYDCQKGEEPFERPVLTPKRELWRAYQIWVKAHQFDRTEEWSLQRESEKLRRSTLRADFKRSKGAIWSDRSLTRQQKRSNISVINMAKALAEKELSERIERERATLSKKWMFMSKDRYYTFLQEEAEKGNESALKELRRVTPDHNSTCLLYTSDAADE